MEFNDDDGMSSNIIDYIPKINRDTYMTETYNGMNDMEEESVPEYDPASINRVNGINYNSYDQFPPNYANSIDAVFQKDINFAGMNNMADICM